MLPTVAHGGVGIDNHAVGGEHVASEPWHTAVCKNACAWSQLESHVVRSQLGPGGRLGFLSSLTSPSVPINPGLVNCGSVLHSFLRLRAAP